MKSSTNEPNIHAEMFQRTSWEWHPIYGCYSRFILVYDPILDGYRAIGREYKYPYKENRSGKNKRPTYVD